MFQPPCCPNPECTNHDAPRPGFYRRHGNYRSRVKREQIPRFRCDDCGRSFSTQTFRVDYRDRKPHLNRAAFVLVTSGVSLRQGARVLGMTYNNYEHKVRKLALHASLADANLQARVSANDRATGRVRALTFQFDEFESYEGCRRSRPVTVPVLIEKGSRFHVSAGVGTLRCKARKTEEVEELIEKDRARFGERRDESRSACAAVLAAGASLVSTAQTVRIDTDRKQAYVGLIRAAFQGKIVRHTRVSSKAPRGAGTKLFAINHTEDIYRDHLARLRRECWTGTKTRPYLVLFLRAYQALRNWVRPRYSGERKSPAQRLGFAGRRLGIDELLRWRQDLRARSVSPFWVASNEVARPAT